MLSRNELGLGKICELEIFFYSRVSSACLTWMKLDFDNWAFRRGKLYLALTGLVSGGCVRRFDDRRTDTLEKRMVVMFMCMDQVSLASRAQSCYRYTECNNAGMN
jgi:hypothetical protein